MKIDFEQMMTPIWDTDIVYAESLTMILDSKGKAKAPLLYNPISILSVTNASLTETYYEGEDWIIEGNSLCLTENSRIFAFKQEEIYPIEEIPGESFPAEKNYILYKEGSFFHQHQICVTYICEKGEWNGVKPIYMGDRIPITMNKLLTGQRVDIVLYGDSISHGSNASQRSDMEPFQKPYAELFYEALSRRYKSGIHFVNSSIGGKDSGWGLENIERMVIDYYPDLVILAFGMNDGWRTKQDFENNISSMINAVRKSKSDTEFILVATSTPNPQLTNDKAKFVGNQAGFKAVLDKIAMNKGIIVADITGMQKALHTKKRFVDTTGNHVNHPNDFFHRLYAQFLFGLLNKKL